MNTVRFTAEVHTECMLGMVPGMLVEEVSFSHTMTVGAAVEWLAAPDVRSR